MSKYVVNSSKPSNLFSIHSDVDFSICMTAFISIYGYDQCHNITIKDIPEILHDNIYALLESVVENHDFEDPETKDHDFESISAIITNIKDEKKETIEELCNLKACLLNTFYNNKRSVKCSIIEPISEGFIYTFLNFTTWNDFSEKISMVYNENGDPVEYIHITPNSSLIVSRNDRDKFYADLTPDNDINGLIFLFAYGIRMN